MTENRRIVLNIVATYGRSLFALGCGVYGGRWALMSLGEIDYGLHGVVGGLTAFIGFFNGILAMSVGRFYTLTVGQSRREPAEALEESRRWFSIALAIHTLIPLVLLVAGWPVGEWAIRHFLTIPPDRVTACLWVFRFSCVGCLIGMTAVPFHAFYGAKQLIAELTVYGFATSALNIAMLWYMVTHPGAWLVKYALWLTLLNIVPSLIISCRACRKFPECRFRFAYCLDWKRCKELFVYAFWQMFGSLSVLLRTHGLSVLINKYFGPSVNASMAIAKNVNGKANELSSSMVGAFMPAITSAWGEGNVKRAHSLTLSTCKFGTLSSLIFTIPLAVELPYVMRLWLVNPPRWVCAFCIAVMIRLTAIRTTNGLLTLIQATGRLGVYEMTVDGIALLMLPLAWFVVASGGGEIGICIVIATVSVVYSWIRPFFAWHLAGMSIRLWLSGVLLPMLAIVFFSLVAGLGVRIMMHEGLLRLALSVIACEAVILPIAWVFMLGQEERDYIREKTRKCFSRFRRNPDAG